MEKKLIYASEWRRMTNHEILQSIEIGVTVLENRRLLEEDFNLLTVILADVANLVKRCASQMKPKGDEGGQETSLSSRQS